MIDKYNLLSAASCYLHIDLSMTYKLCISVQFLFYNQIHNNGSSLTNQTILCLSHELIL